MTENETVLPRTQSKLAIGTVPVMLWCSYFVGSLMWFNEVRGSIKGRFNPTTNKITIIRRTVPAH